MLTRGEKNLLLKKLNKWVDALHMAKLYPDAAVYGEDAQDAEDELRRFIKEDL